MGMFDVPPRQPMYACKDCGRQATKEQVFSAAEKCKDLSAMMQGLTPWQCKECRLGETSKPGAITPMKATPLNLASTQEIIEELMSRFEHCIVAHRTYPQTGVNEVQEGFYHRGDYRMCQGLAVGMEAWIQEEVMKTRARHRQG